MGRLRQDAVLSRLPSAVTLPRFSAVFVDDVQHRSFGVYRRSSRVTAHKTVGANGHSTPGGPTDDYLKKVFIESHTQEETYERPQREPREHGRQGLRDPSD